ncbi:hypothetical protein [Rathayibacter sp. VKM Ac-2857]|uniref:hypothetical protein n=1 Tax=Rathayibacter sp. VKM Ac-2857 TaxID=2739020 RepID=UPI001567AB79|nr:hypothetical protein [Rathayibacter sp. VKM Ac-2857]NQX17247.1 hypothetical protein [Rathayibacter sp. VKM Ac-2857]
MTINADKHPNAASVLFRVFVELSVDDYIVRHKLISDENNPNLAKRLKDVNNHLLSNSAIPKQLHLVIQQIANNKHGLAASMVTFNQYVHNSYSFPKPSELRTSWDEMQPFLEAVWK